MFSLHREIEELLEKYPDPRRGSEGIWAFNKRQIADSCYPRPGVVADNKDPLCLGRVRVACDMLAPGAVTGWIPVLSQGAGKGHGWWLLPDIGTQVILAFLWKNINNPIVLGCIYDLKHRPPQHSTQNPADSIVLQTKNHRLEIIDEEGKEAFLLSTKKGQIRLSMTKGKGIELINELGDIRIQCRKLKVQGDEEVSVQAKKFDISSEGEMRIHSKNAKFKCDKEVRFKGKNIKLNASKGVLVEGKQLAGAQDKVMGFDIHRMVVPSGSGTSIVPLPHPFIGKIAEGVSDNVKISGRGAATKGSIAKHDHPVHNQLPGTIKFQQGPKKEGTVTNNTAKTVKINGKEAAVIGSTVTTCNDTGAKDNSTILAVGAAMPMPMIINPKNTEEYLKGREESQKTHPEFTQVQWGKGAVKEGEEVELLANVKDITDGNPVVFQVWKEGQDPTAHIALMQLAGAVQGGSATVKWIPRFADVEELPEKDPRYYFTAHSAWCPLMKSEMATVKLKRPELTDPQWKDNEGNQTDKGLVGEAVRLSVSCNDDMEEGAGVIFRVYADGSDPKHDAPTAELASTNKDGTAEVEWTYQYKHDPDNPLKEKPKFFFTAEGSRCKAESGNVEMSQAIRISVLSEHEEPLKDVPYELYFPDDSTKEGTSDADGRIVEEDLIPGMYYITVKNEESEDG